MMRIIAPNPYRARPPMRKGLKIMDSREKGSCWAPGVYNTWADDVRSVHKNTSRKAHHAVFMIMMERKGIYKDDVSKNDHFSKISTILANAGLVTKTPTLTPMIVVRANPLNNPAPANPKGSMATTIVAYAPKIIKKAFFILFFQSKVATSFEPALSSSTMTIWSFTPVPIVMMM